MAAVCAKSACSKFIVQKRQHLTLNNQKCVKQKPVKVLQKEKKNTEHLKSIKHNTQVSVLVQGISQRGPCCYCFSSLSGT